MKPTPTSSLGSPRRRTRRPAWLLLLGMAVALAALVDLAFRIHRMAAAESRPAPSPGAAAAGEPGSGLGEADRRQELAARRAREVAEVVVERNRESAKQRKALEEGGWTMVDVPPPDEQLLRFDRGLLAGREAELRTQLASTTPNKAHAPAIAEIARQARDPATRVAAVEALGRIRGSEGQAQLVDILRSGALEQDDEARRAVAPLLRPRDLDDPTARSMAQLLDERGLTSVERQQIAFTLALIGLRDGTALPDSVQAAMSRQSASLIESMAAVAGGQRGGPGQPTLLKGDQP